VNKKDLDRVHEACEGVETGQHNWSCTALEFGFSNVEMPELRDRYAAFYEKKANEVWFPGGENFDPFTKDQRILLLLLFAEAEQDVQ
jgi:hypothetical protein